MIGSFKWNLDSNDLNERRKIWFQLLIENKPHTQMFKRVMLIGRIVVLMAILAIQMLLLIMMVIIMTKDKELV